MLWARSKLVEIYLGQTMVGCRGFDDLGDRWAEVTGLDEGLEHLSDWLLTPSTPVRARVWVGSTLARPFVLAANCGARNVSEARELASAAAGDLTGLEGELKAWLAPWRASQATLAVAMPQAVLRALATRAESRRGLRLVSVRPWWNQVLDAVIDRSRVQSRSIGWTLVEPDGLVHARVVSGEVLDAAFEVRRMRDLDAAMLRRRLAIGWGHVDDAEHFVFSESVAPRSPLFAIGGASLAQADEVAA